MAVTVQLDYELFGKTGEVGYVVADWVLAPEAKAVQRLASQLQPEKPLGLGHIPP